MRWRAHRCHWRQWDYGIKCRLPLAPQKKGGKSPPLTRFWAKSLSGHWGLSWSPWEALIQPLCWQGRQSPASKTGHSCTRCCVWSLGILQPLLLQALPGLPPGTLHHTDEEKLLVFNSLLHVQQWGPFTALDEPNKTCSVISLGLMNKVESVREGLAILLCSAAFCSQRCPSLTCELWLGESSAPFTGAKDVPQKYWT